MRYLITAITTVIVSLAMASCHKIDDDRIPPVPVYISFNSVGMWLSLIHISEPTRPY